MFCQLDSFHTKPFIYSIHMHFTFIFPDWLKCTQKNTKIKLVKKWTDPSRLRFTYTCSERERVREREWERERERDCSFCFPCTAFECWRANLHKPWGRLWRTRHTYAQTLWCLTYVKFEIPSLPSFVKRLGSYQYSSIRLSALFWTHSSEAFACLVLLSFMHMH